MSWVTILTPLFNGIEYFEECYNSILCQTEQGFTWIIGVNGHGDDSNDIYVMLKNRISDSRVRVKNYATVGKVNTLNEMIKDVTTPYVALCDCDDAWILNKLEVQKQILEKYPMIDVLGTNLQYIGELNHIPQLPFGKITYDILCKINPVVNSSVVLKKECCGWVDRFGLEDYDLWFRLVLLQNKNIFTIQEPFILHRIHKTSAFNNSGVQDVKGLLNYYNKNDVTVVSAFYPIKSKYSLTDYLKWMKFWSQCKCNLVFFTVEEFVPIIENLRKDIIFPTKIIPLEFSQLDGVKKYGMDFWQKEYLKDNESYHTPELYILWYEKKGFVKRAIELNYTEVAFDRAGYKYHGRVKALADGAREAGLNF